MPRLIRNLTIAFCVLAIVGLVACSAGPSFRYESDSSIRALTEKAAPPYPQTSFIVFSDPHTYATELGTEGKAFEDYLASDRKLLKESTEILESVIEAIRAEKASFVIVPGDLTKDGERASHELFASYLSRLEASGKQVYIVPGNHDIRNGHAFKYVGDKTERVPTVTPEEFTRIYSEYGYQEALYRDAASLSYVAEPQAGLWLLALDSCRYAENQEDSEPITDGRFSSETLHWIEEMLAEAAEQDKAVIAMLHHGIVEHYKGQEKYFGEYLLDDYAAVSKVLATYNVRLVFTGHYHAQDITVKRGPKANKFVFDIETGSLITYPSPYRIVSITASQRATVQTQRVTSIRTHPDDFQEYALAYIKSGVANIAARAIQSYGVEPAEAENLGQQVAQAFVAHYTGDESLPAGQKAISTHGLSLRGRIVVTIRKGLIQGLWRDLAPPDNNVTIDLSTGEWQ
jgi:3',5'-cyclic AMP phosphodiesterase CpdA